MSVGIALYPDDGRDLQSLLCSSDAAMYSDKSLQKASRSAASVGESSVWTVIVRSSSESNQVDPGERVVDLL